jgi:serine/threonine-protein kinase
MTDARLPVPLGAIVGGKYRVERVLGSGGMGIVVAATHIELGQAVALKFLLPQTLSGQENIERFIREARVVVRLKSEHVARVLDVGRDEDRPFMVLELLEGLDLAKLKKKSGAPPIADAVEYVLQACEALVEAHGIGIVHRDLKPQNIFISRRLNGAPLVKVLDFGISKAIGPAAVGQLVLTDSSAIMGSPLYMAPEQMRAARLADIRSDVWALGVILYELLGGRVPFDGETVTEVCIRVVNDPPCPLAELRPGLDPRLVAAVMKCLEKDPDARFQSCAALAVALEPFASSSRVGPARAWRSMDDTQDPRSFASADDTGPSTAVTLVDRKAPEVLAATDVSWGQATPPPPPPSGRKGASNAAFGRGLGVGAIVTILAGGIAAIFAFSSPRPKTVAAPPAVTVSAPPPEPAAEPTPAAAPAPVPPPPAIAVSALPSTRVGRPRPVSVAPASPAPPPPPPAPAETKAPNGAPILR